MENILFFLIILIFFLNDFIAFYCFMANILTSDSVLPSFRPLPISDQLMFGSSLATCGLKEISFL